MMSSATDGFPQLPSASALGFTEREALRMSVMMLRSEPLPHEIFGLQLLVGSAGGYLAGFIGLLLGTLHLAPGMAYIPGRPGESFRRAGWQTFAGVRAGVRRSEAAWAWVGRWAADGCRPVTLAARVSNACQVGARSMLTRLRAGGASLFAVLCVLLGKALEPLEAERRATAMRDRRSMER